jgi:hypothetical protein
MNFPHRPKRIDHDGRRHEHWFKSLFREVDEYDYDFSDLSRRELGQMAVMLVHYGGAKKKQCGFVAGALKRVNQNGRSKS